MWIVIAWTETLIVWNGSLGASRAPVETEERSRVVACVWRLAPLDCVDDVLRAERCAQDISEERGRIGRHGALVYTYPGSEADPLGRAKKDHAARK